MTSPLEALLPRLAPMVDYTTVQIADLISGPKEAQQRVCKLLVKLAERHPGLAERGDPRPGKGLMTGKTVRPWVWRRLDAEQVATIMRGQTNASSLVNRVAELEARVAKLEEGR